MNLTINNTPILGASFATKKENRATIKQGIQSGMSANHISMPLVDKNYARLQTKSMNVSFKGLPPVPVKSVGEKVSNLLGVARSNDVIVVAPNIKKAVSSLEKNLSSFKTVFKRMFFVEDKTMADAVAFKRNLASKEAVNLTENPVFIKDAKGQKSFLNPGESGYLLEGDTIKVGNKKITIKEPETTAPLKESYDMMLELDKDVEPSIAQINKRSLAKMKEMTGEAKPVNKIMFGDVGGQDKAITTLKRSILYPIKYPELRNGKNMNKAVLLEGPPGTGKSLLAEATANESGAWFRKINASELDSKWVGESEENWKNLFEEARQKQPALIFIDEIDAIAKKRGGQDVYGDKTLNTILGLMSDSEKRGDEIYMVAATNNMKAIDSAVTRSGRFGTVVYVGAPDLKGTEQIFDIHTKTEPLAKDLDKKSVIAKLHKNKATGADIASISETARTNALERENIYEKIDAGTYTPADMQNLTLKTEDFEKAIDDFAKKQTPAEKSRNPIGYTSSVYK